MIRYCNKRSANFVHGKVVSVKNCFRDLILIPFFLRIGQIRIRNFGNSSLKVLLINAKSEFDGIFRTQSIIIDTLVIVNVRSSTFETCYILLLCKCANGRRGSDFFKGFTPIYIHLLLCHAAHYNSIQYLSAKRIDAGVYTGILS